MPGMALARTRYFAVVHPLLWTVCKAAGHIGRLVLACGVTLLVGCPPLAALCASAPASETVAFPTPASGPIFAGGRVVWASVIPERDWGVQLFSASPGGRARPGVFVGNPDPLGNDAIDSKVSAGGARVVLTFAATCADLSAGCGYLGFLDVSVGEPAGPLSRLVSCSGGSGNWDNQHFVPASLSGRWALVYDPGCGAPGFAWAAVGLVDVQTGQRVMIQGAQPPLAAATGLVAWTEPGEIVVAKVPNLTPVRRVPWPALAPPAEPPNLLRIDSTGDIVAAWGGLAYWASPSDQTLRPLPRLLVNDNYAIANGRVVSWTPGVAGDNPEAAIAVGEVDRGARVLVRVVGIHKFGLDRVAGEVDTDGRWVIWAQPTCDGAVIRVRAVTAPPLLIHQHECKLTLRRRPVARLGIGVLGNVYVDTGVICDDDSLQPCGRVKLSASGHTIAENDGEAPETAAFLTNRGARLLMRHPRLVVRLTLDRSTYSGSADSRPHLEATNTYLTATASARAFLRQHPCRVIICPKR